MVKNIPRIIRFKFRIHFFAYESTDVVKPLVGRNRDEFWLMPTLYRIQLIQYEIS